jgi:hypothetical protein
MKLITKININIIWVFSWHCLLTEYPPYNSRPHFYLCAHCQIQEGVLELLARLRRRAQNSMEEVHGEFSKEE